MVMEMTDRQKKVLLTAGIGGGMWLLLTANIFFAFKNATTEQNLLSIFNGAMLSYWVLLYYNTLKSIDNRRAAKNLSNETQEEVVKHAQFIATTLKQGIDLKGFPLSYFRRVGINRVSVHSGCSSITHQPEVEFWLTYVIRIDSDAGVEITSKFYPVELAPEWLKKESLFQDAVKRKMGELEAEMKENCKGGAIDKLRKSMT